jgi:hypothetical protein
MPPTIETLVDEIRDLKQKLPLVSVLAESPKAIISTLWDAIKRNIALLLSNKTYEEKGALAREAAAIFAVASDTGRQKKLSGISSSAVASISAYEC